MPFPSPLSDELAELIADRFRVVADPTRIKLLDRLRAGEASVNELADDLGASQQNVSKHLSVLAHAGILARRKEGTFAYYRIADTGVLNLCDEVCGSLQAQLRALTALVEGDSPRTRAATAPSTPCSTT